MFNQTVITVSSSGTTVFSLVTDFYAGFSNHLVLLTLWCYSVMFDQNILGFFHLFICFTSLEWYRTW